MASPRSPHYSCARDTDKTPDFTRAKGKEKKEKNQVIVAKNAWEMKRKCKKENNNGIAIVPPTYNPANAWELGPMAREITKRMVWWKGEKSLVSVSC